MKALSIRQPWVQLIALGLKDIEVRYWPKRHKWPDQIAIHVSQRVDSGALYLVRQIYLLDVPGKAKGYYRGGVIAKARIAGVRTYDTAKEFNADFECHLNPTLTDAELDKKRGKGKCYGLILTHVKLLGPVDCRGQLGFWEFDSA